jgi:hypothetical protein
MPCAPQGATGIEEEQQEQEEEGGGDLVVKIYVRISCRVLHGTR